MFPASSTSISGFTILRQVLKFYNRRLVRRIVFIIMFFERCQWFRLFFIVVWLDRLSIAMLIFFIWLTKFYWFETFYWLHLLIICLTSHGFLYCKSRIKTIAKVIDDNIRLCFIVLFIIFSFCIVILVISIISLFAIHAWVGLSRFLRSAS